MPNPTPGRIENDNALILQAGRLIAEFSFWPLGWVLTFDGEPALGTVEKVPQAGVELSTEEDG
jgi:hypothetical protein